MKYKWGCPGGAGEVDHDLFYAREMMFNAAPLRLKETRVYAEHLLESLDKTFTSVGNLDQIRGYILSTIAGTRLLLDEIEENGNDEKAVEKRAGEVVDSLASLLKFALKRRDARGAGFCWEYIQKIGSYSYFLDPSASEWDEEDY